MSITPIDFVAAQLRAAAPDAEWMHGGIDRAQELASIFVAGGVNSLMGMRIEPFDFVEIIKGTCYPAYYGDAEQAAYCDPDVSVTHKGHSLIIGDKTFGWLGEPGKPQFEAGLREYDTGLAVGWSPAGHGHVDFVIRPLIGGFGFVPVWASSSDAGF